MDLKELKKAAEVIASARIIYLFGVGTSGMVADYASYRFTRIGLLTKSYMDSHLISMSTATIQANDVVIAISQSGSTTAIVKALESVKKCGANIISITSHSRSPVTKSSSIVLRSSVHETPFESGDMPSLMAQLSVVDALMVAAALENFDASMNRIQAATEALKSKKL
nr:MurR/RpiR family transcriptional regulator [Paenibacillus sp. SYP-B3998]